MRRASVLGCGLVVIIALAACESSKRQADTTRALAQAPDTVKPAAADTTKKATTAGSTTTSRTTTKKTTSTTTAAGTKTAAKKDSIIGRDSVIKRPPIRLPVVKKPPQ